MKKIKLTKEEKKACRDVIATWKKNKKRWESGDRIVGDDWMDFTWKKDGTDVVPFFGCPLCDIQGGIGCRRCSYYKAYGYECMEPKGHLGKLSKNPNLRSINACVRAVQRILDNAK